MQQTSTLNFNAPRATELASNEGFRIIHHLVIITGIITCVVGAITHANGFFSGVASVTGILVSGLSLWYIIKAWKNSEFSGQAFRVSIVLYFFALNDELGGMLAKGAGGEFADGYFNIYMPASILIILSLWLWLVLSADEYVAAREERYISIQESRESRKLKMEERYERIAAKREVLKNKKLLRRGRMMLVGQRSDAVLKELSGRSNKKAVRAFAKGAVYDLRLKMGITGDKNKGKDVPTFSLSGDGAPSFK